MNTSTLGGGNGVGNFLEIINTYLEDNVDQGRWWLHQNYADEYYRMAQGVHDTNVAHRIALQQKEELERQVAYFKQAKGYRLMAKVYSIYYKLRGKR